MLGGVMDKAAEIREILSRLSAKQALALARGVETQRALGQEELPTEAILAALRPQLRSGRPQRVPTLCRLVCVAFEDFLGDGRAAPRPPGLIARTVITPWWEGMKLFAGLEIENREAELRRFIAAKDLTRATRLGEKAWHEAHLWSDALLTLLRRKKPDPTAGALFADRALIGDLQEIVRLLPVGGALRQAVDAVLAVATQQGEAENRAIRELGPAAVAEAARQYLALKKPLAAKAPYFILALLNRLEHPAQVLRLLRALSSAPAAALSGEGEFAAIGRRLIAELEHRAQAIATAAAAPEAAVAALGTAIARYVAEAEELAAPDVAAAGWAGAILQTRLDVARAIDDEFLARVGAAIAAALPAAAGDPSAGEVKGAHAIDAARFLAFLMRHGERHGFAAPAQYAGERAFAELERRGDALAASGTMPALAERIATAIEAANLLFEKRGDALAQRWQVRAQPAA